MKWFSEENQFRVMKLFSLGGFLAGTFWGFSVGGVGGAILFALLGALAGLIISFFVAWIFDEEAVVSCIGIALLITIPILLISLIAWTWDFGK